MGGLGIGILLAIAAVLDLAVVVALRTVRWIDASGAPLVSVRVVGP